MNKWLKLIEVAFVALMLTLVSVLAAVVSILIGPFVVMMAGFIMTLRNRKTWWKGWKKGLKRLIGGIALSPASGPMLASHFIFGRKAKTMWGWSKNAQRLVFTAYSTLYWILFVLCLVALRH